MDLIEDIDVVMNPIMSTYRVGWVPFMVGEDALQGFDDRVE